MQDQDHDLIYKTKTKTQTDEKTHATNIMYKLHEIVHLFVL